MAMWFAYLACDELRKRARAGEKRVTHSYDPSYPNVDIGTFGDYNEVPWSTGYPGR